MQKAIQKYKKNKLLTILVTIMFFSILLGIFYIALLNNDNKLLIKDNLTNYLNYIKANKVIIHAKNYFQIINSNLFITMLIWLLGISLIGIPLIIIIFSFKSFLTSFTFVSIIYNYGLKGLIFGSIYLIPIIFNLLLSFILAYYALNFSYILFNHLFKKQTYNFHRIVKRYLRLLIISLLLSLFNSLIEIFLVPNLLKFLYF